MNSGLRLAAVTHEGQDEANSQYAARAWVAKKMRSENYKKSMPSLFTGVTNALQPKVSWPDFNCGWVYMCTL